MLVVGYHWVGRYAPLGDGGYIGVDVFFVLSGYIITTMLWGSTRVGSVSQQMTVFLKRRLRRLYPALVGFVVVGGLIFAVLPGVRITPEQILQRAIVTLTQATSLWMTPDTSRWPPYGQTWSLADEWFFYLLWPLLLFLLKRAGVTAAVASRLAGAGALGLYVSALGFSGWHFYVYPVARGGEMLAGAALALAVLGRSSAKPASRVPWGALSYVGLLGLALYATFGPHFATPVFRWVGVPVSVIATLVLIRSGLESDRGILHDLLTWPPLTLLGRVSYSLYLWHLVPIWGLDKDAWSLSPIVLAIVGVAFTVVATTASYLLLERPFLSSQAGSLQRLRSGDSGAEAAARPRVGPSRTLPRQRKARRLAGASAPESDRFGEALGRPRAPAVEGHLDRDH